MQAEDLVNNSLELIGHPNRISSFYDGTREAIVANDIYAQTRDEVLAMQPWDFARNRISMTAAGLAVPAPWTNEFIYPSTSVKLLDVYTIPASDVVPIRWQEIIDTRIAIPYRGVVCNFTSATAVFTERVIETSAYPPDFALMLIKELGEKFRVEFAKEVQSAARGRSQQLA